jgi:hypothetical protein
MFDSFARMSQRQGLSFDAQGAENVVMDISEFSRWTHDYGLVPKYLSLEKMKSIFRESNVGDHADEFRHTFDYNEFVECVRRCVNEATIACGDGALPAKISHLRSLLAGEMGESTQIIATQAETMSANLMAAYDHDNASDGVRVPVSTLWSSVREVESHLQTEEQLRAALDRLAAQAKSEVSQLERQKAAAVAALEASEDQLLELEREANAQLDELQLQRDEAKAEAATAKEEMEKLHVDYERKIKAMDDIILQANADRDKASEERDEAFRIQEAANEERELVYGDARTMASERDELARQNMLDEANWKKELSAQERRMNETIADLERQLATERTEHQIRLRQAEERFEVDLEAAEKRHTEAVKKLEEERRKQVEQLDLQLQEEKRNADQAARDAAQKFRDADNEWQTKVRNLNAELETARMEKRAVDADLSRTQRTLEVSSLCFTLPNLIMLPRLAKMSTLPGPSVKDMSLPSADKNH